MTAAEASALPMSRARDRRGGVRLSVQLVLFEIRKQAAGSVLGVAWAVVQPLLFLATYWFLLTVLDSKHLGPGGTQAQVAVLLSGLVTWLFVARSLGASMGTLTSHAGLIRNINFPVSVLPFVAIGVKAVDYGVGLLVVTVAAVVAGLASWELLLLVPASLLLGIFLISTAAILGPIAVMLRDLTRLTQVVLRAGLFLTPVLYLPSALPEEVAGIAYLNPIAYYISLVRYAATRVPDALMFSLPIDMAIASGLALTMVVCAYLLRGFVRRPVVDHL